MMSNNFQYHIHKHSTGSTAIGLKASKIGWLRVILPPLPEQQAIASFLDRETARINRIIEKQTRLIELLKEKRSALITQAVTRGLDPNAKMKDSSVEWIGEIPEGWEVKKVKWLITSIKSGDGITREEIQEGGSYPVYGGNGIIGYSDKTNCAAPVLILGRVGALCGNVHHVEQDSFVTDNALVMKIKTDITREYLFHVLVSMNLNQYASQNAQPLITGTLIKKMSIPIPPKDEQLTITEYIENETMKIDKLLNKIEKQIDLLNEYKQSLITAAVTGKIDVRDVQ